MALFPEVTLRLVKGTPLTYQEMDSNFANLQSSGVPVGTVYNYPTQIPALTGWLVCDGASLAVAVYDDLFGALSYTWGGAGANFNIPDLRGLFVRGFDSGAGNDPDRIFASLQQDELKAHLHTKGERPGAVQATSGNHVRGYVDEGNTGTTGGDETRPINQTMNFIIKAVL